MRKNIPVIVEGAVPLSSIQGLNTSFLPNTRTLQGHTVVMVPLENYEEYKAKVRKVSQHVGAQTLMHSRILCFS